MAQNRKARRAAAASAAAKAAARGKGPAPHVAAPAVAKPVTSSPKAPAAPAPAPNPANAAARAFRVGLDHYEAKRYGEAELVFRRIVAALEKGAGMVGGGPTLAQALNALGVVMRMQSRYSEAVQLYERSLTLEPGNAGVFSNLGNALKDDHQIEGAIEAHKIAVGREPNDAKIHHNLGVSYVQAGRFADGLRHYDRALELQPNFPDAAWDRARALLYLGDYARGWPAYESRWQLAEQRGRKRPGPAWDGKRFDGKRLFLYGEQGFGDTVQCARYLPMVKALGGTVILECQPQLITLMDGLGIDEIVPPNMAGPPAPAPAHDLIYPLLSLPRFFTPDIASVPGRVPYLNVPAGRAEKFADVFGRAVSKLKVGIVWSGSVTFKGNRDRAMRLASFLHAFDVPGVQLYSLQKGPPEIELKTVGAESRLIDLAPLLGDFADTAAAIQGLDLVLMTDSAVAHLTGALGRPIWVLVSFVAHWLWLKDRESDNPWYPTMRLFRQSHPGEWGAVDPDAYTAATYTVPSGRVGCRSRSRACRAHRCRGGRPFPAPTRQAIATPTVRT
jgi:tetratricopeptide (TPR) repeat protein